jgi:crotonobetainyl-CoA:carnitine CoA-transferase CaiB-like acyl-CoA transferase
MMEDALKGIRILEVGTMTPGKFTGFLLTGWGAKSLRIERPSGPQDPAIGDEDHTQPGETVDRAQFTGAEG